MEVEQVIVEKRPRHELPLNELEEPQTSDTREVPTDQPSISSTSSSRIFTQPILHSNTSQHLMPHFYSQNPGTSSILGNF